MSNLNAHNSKTNNKYNDKRKYKYSNNCKTKSTLNNNYSNEKKDVLISSKHVMTCNSEYFDTLPIINLKFGNFIVPALIDTGANLSLIDPNTLNEIKEEVKVNYLSRSVRIHTIDNSTVPYMSAISSKFKIDTKWFTGNFFVTRNPWTYKYKIILGYDFIQQNRIILDIPSKKLIMGTMSFNFCEETPSFVNNVLKMEKDIFVKTNSKIILEPNSQSLIKLTLSRPIVNSKQILFTPIRNKLKYHMNESVNIVEDDHIYTLISNNTNSNIIVNKGTKLGKVINIDDKEFVKPTENKVLQTNNLNLKEIQELRKTEINESDFDLSHLNDADAKLIKQFLMRNSEVFSKSYSTLGSTNAVIPDFNLLHQFPIQTKPYPIPNIAKPFAKKEIDSLLKAGIIEHSSSNYCFPILFVKKKPYVSDPKLQKFRMVIDYRLLNSVTETFKICLPNIKDILHSISGKKLYVSLDLKSAFFQLQLKEEDKAKLAFMCELGNFQPTRLPFGSKNSTSYFHILISKCLDDIKGPNVQYFLDDIVLAANSIQEMLEILKNVFDRLKKFNLTLDPAKMQICKPEITYLGFNVNSDGFSPALENVNKIVNFPIPKNVKEIQTFLGMVNYFRHLIFNFAEIVKPLINLTKKNVKFIWSNDCQKAIDLISEQLLLKPTLKNIDPNSKFYIVTDASCNSLCGILMQKVNNQFVPIEFHSRQLNFSESKYPSIRRELLAIVDSVKYFHQHLYGKDFVIFTDAKALTFHIDLQKQPEIVSRWLMYLQEFNYKIEFIPGLKNPADYLTRVEVTDTVVNNAYIFKANENLKVENLIKNQQNCPESQQILQKLKDNDQFTCKRYCVNDEGLLMMKIIPPKAPHKTLIRIYIPTSLRAEILKEAHASHFGFFKTYNLLKRHYSWLGMLSDCQNFVETCDACNLNKPKPKLTQSNFIEKGNLGVGQIISLDIVGKLPRSVDNKFFIMTIIDNYSRYLEAIPLSNIKSATIINGLNDYFSKFGLPQAIITDNGTNFTSHEITDFFQTLNIQHRKTSIYYPLSNGLLERSHRILKESIAAMCNESWEWSKKLLFFKLYYNSSIHVVTGFTPAELYFGRNLTLPLNINVSAKKEGKHATYLKKLTETLAESREIVSKNENKYFDQHKKHIKGRTIPHYNVDEMVYVKINNDIHSLDPKYQGPHKIVKKFRNNNYLVLIDENTQLYKKYHVSKLFLKKERKAYNNDEECTL